MAKYYLFILILTAAVVGLLAVGFIYISNPFLEHDKLADQKRVTDLTAINDAISQYYSQHQKLPDSLPFNSGYNYNMSFNDPVTRSLYEYKQLSPIQYELCGNFLTDTNQNQPSTPSTVNLGLIPTSNSQNFYNHTKGHFCVTNTIANSYYYQPTPAVYNYPRPSVYPTPYDLPIQFTPTPIQTSNQSVQPTSVPNPTSTPIPTTTLAPPFTPTPTP